MTAPSKTKAFLPIIAIVCALALAPSAASAAADLYAAPAEAGTHDCSSAANACAFSDAVTAAADGDAIHVAGGDYTYADFSIVKRVSILGPASGTPATFIGGLGFDLPAGADPVTYSDFTVRADFPAATSPVEGLTFTDDDGLDVGGKITFDHVVVRLSSASGAIAFHAKMARDSLELRNSLFFAKSTSIEYNSGAIATEVDFVNLATSPVEINNITAVAAAQSPAQTVGLGVLDQGNGVAEPCGPRGSINVRNSILRGTTGYPYDVGVLNASGLDSTCLAHIYSRNSNWGTVLNLTPAVAITSTNDQKAMPV